MEDTHYSPIEASGHHQLPDKGFGDVSDCSVYCLRAYRGPCLWLPFPGLSGRTAAGRPRWPASRGLRTSAAPARLQG
ncbi:hypothetical protein EYF80_021726 [Liparis tanakae]|uniref:Uncharacterized protein n=1 Tax=Liparis tanakae TaxID=230148 RepID=A0A4Z2HR81_9TELE|nr:hypothetical protein EYF80_021726 [Liparis tanakae]